MSISQHLRRRITHSHRRSAYGLLLAASVLLVACGGGETESVTEVEAATTQPAEVDETDAAEVEAETAQDEPIAEAEEPTASDEPIPEDETVPERGTRLSADLEVIMAAVEFPNDALTAAIGEYELVSETGDAAVLLPCRLGNGSFLGAGHNYIASGSFYGNSLLALGGDVSVADHFDEALSSEIGCTNSVTEENFVSIEEVTIGGSPGIRWASDSTVVTQVDLGEWIAQGVSLGSPEIADALALELVNAANS